LNAHAHDHCVHDAHDAHDDDGDGVDGIDDDACVYKTSYNKQTTKSSMHQPHKTIQQETQPQAINEPIWHQSN
ncbi:hypothetical protein NPN14_24235, partial [Vibrio parahaemolyticus]|nr:hypothetical protein [Vibrio parahaemolyticus]